jgi:putative hydrolase of the HAD superfamily
MKYKAVIFDLFGTLVGKISQKDRNKVLENIAGVLDIPEDDFSRLWFSTFADRDAGLYATVEDNFAAILQTLGKPVFIEKTRCAAEINNEYYSQAIRQRPYAEETLFELKCRGHKIGLISGCSPEVPDIFNALSIAKYFDARVFSCVAKLSKPDPEIYEMSASQLRVKPEDCLYIGDGDGQELTGAAGVGMHPVLIRDPQENPEDVYRVDNEAQDWKGPVITSLKEVLSLV